MKGQPNKCSICGVDGEILGAPTFFAQCVNMEECRQRVINKKDKEIRELKNVLIHWKRNDN